VENPAIYPVFRYETQQTHRPQMSLMRHNLDKKRGVFLVMIRTVRIFLLPTQPALSKMQRMQPLVHQYGVYRFDNDNSQCLLVRQSQKIA